MPANEPMNSHASPDTPFFDNFDTNGAAQYLRVSAPTIRMYVQTGQLKANRLGNGPKGRYRFTRAQLDEFMSRPAFTDRELPEDF